MAVVQDYRARTPIPSDAWDQDYNHAHPEQFMSYDEMDREIDAAVYEPDQDQFFTVPGGSSSWDWH
ncbi:hypothetical protein A2U01_0060450 [Trifolium medium]|uniref:Uncharacterized protein n=1 Tax=Trifolium medium TaxID=97028 RepID=A0A392RSA1_9FABA|nr:hypothetical protein [Trifolium medium]